MSKLKQIIKVQDTMYYCLGTMLVENTNYKGTEYWKERWNADHVLRNGNQYYFCQLIINAEFEDI